MATRYSGDLKINVTYDDRNFYRTSVRRGNELLWRGRVNPAASGFGPGIAYDSAKAYDQIASTALSFADHEVGGIRDDAEYDENLTGCLIRRTPRAKTTSHATRKTTSSFSVGDCVTMREPHRKFLTTSTGADVFKVIDLSGNALTIDGPLDRHPKHRKRQTMGAHMFKRVACPRIRFEQDSAASTRPSSAHAAQKRQARGKQFHGEQYRGAVVGRDVLLGGTKRHVSSWFNTKKEADDWLTAISEGNAAAGRVVDSVLIERRDADGTTVVKIGTGPSPGLKPRIFVRKIEGRWQPVTASGAILRGSVYNADGSGYGTKQGAEEAAAMFRQIGQSA